MAKLGDVIKGKINALVKQAQLATDQYNAGQKVIADAILVEEARLKSMEAYLEQDVEAVKKEFGSIFDTYAADAPRASKEKEPAKGESGKG